MVAYAYHHSPFYRAHWAGAALEEWHTLPTIDKCTMMTHFAHFNTYGIAYETARQVADQAEQSRHFHPILRTRTGQTLTAGLSSGTSGDRGLFLVTEREIAAWAGVMLARVLHGLPWRGCRVAFFLRAFSNLYAGVNSPLLQLRYFALQQPVDEAVRALNSYQPQLLVGPPSLLAALAAAQQAGTLQIAPTRLIAVAEALEPQDERQLHATFGVPVHQIYQCTEGLLAISCAHGALHIQEDLVAIQLEEIARPKVETANAVTQQPPRYTPIVTDLWRTTQPIIRYQLGDLLQVSNAPCACGSAFRVIRAIEGRVADLCYGSTVTGARLPLFPATLRRMVLDSSPAITDYQIVQPQDDQLHIYLDCVPGADFAAVAQQVRSNVTAAVTAHGCMPPTLQLISGMPSRPATTKRRRVQRAAH
jgi:phenylacetate-CoA ligase